MQALNAPAAVEWEPSKGWDRITNNCTLVVHISPLPGQPPLKLSTQQLQQLTAPQVLARLMLHVCSLEFSRA